MIAESTSVHTPTGSSTTDDTVIGLANTHDGSTAPTGSTPFLQNFPGQDGQNTELISDLTYTFDTPVDGIAAIRIHNNAGNDYTDLQSIGEIETINIRDEEGNLLLSLSDVFVGDPTNGAPFNIELGELLDNVASVEFLNVMASPGGADFITVREVSLVEIKAAAIDSDQDGIYDHLDIDADNDGITDNVEA